MPVYALRDETLDSLIAIINNVIYLLGMPVHALRDETLDSLIAIINNVIYLLEMPVHTLGKLKKKSFYSFLSLL